MSASADDLAALSPAERDFLARRMPVDCANGSQFAPAAPEPIDRERILRAADDLRALAARLHSVAQWENALHIRAIERDIREALK